MKDTADPRAVKDDDHWDAYPYFGGAGAVGSGRLNKGVRFDR
jgi:hypothetical protein